MNSTHTLFPILLWCPILLLLPATTSWSQPPTEVSGPGETVSAVGDPAPLTTSLVVTTDATCELSLDGESLGVLAASSPRTIDAAVGEHTLEATSVTEPTIRVRETFFTDNAELREVSIELADLETELQTKVATARCMERPEACFREVGSEILEDSRHSVMWSRRSSGHDQNWTAAIAVCRASTLGDHADWRLPTIDELETLTRRDLTRTSCGAADCQIYPQFELSRPWIWSSSEKEPGVAWHFLFDLGLRHPVPTGLTELTGTLCVRNSK